MEGPGGACPGIPIAALVYALTGVVEHRDTPPIRPEKAEECEGFSPPSVWTQMLNFFTISVLGFLVLHRVNVAIWILSLFNLDRTARVTTIGDFFGSPDL